MFKQINLVMLLIFVSISFGFNPKFVKPNKLVKAPFLQEVGSVNESSDEKYYDGTTDGYFDKSSNGYGWYLGYNRKIQVFFNPPYDNMYGLIYRRNNPTTGNGTIGGMIGKDTGYPSTPSFNNFAQIIYDSSIYQFGDSLPGGRFPYTCAFINGYLFGLFNDYDVNVADTSQPMFTVGDATWGYDFTSWSDPIRVESADSNFVIQNAWQGIGDVVYDPSTGYYYWTQGWREGLTNSEPGFVLSCVVGRTLTPSDANSWEWTDYNDLRFTTFSTVDTPYLQTLERIHFAYAKDIYGNGTGYGIGVAMTTYTGETNPYLSYIYTSNWGADESSGSLKSNWNAPASSEFIYRVDTADLFDWYGETLTMYDSIGYNTTTGEVVYDSTVVTMDDPFIAWNISAVTTENNIVHVLMKVFPASSQDGYTIYPWTDNGFRSGYYDVKGEITETGVSWEQAVFIANFVDTDKGWKVEDQGMEWKYSNGNTLSLCNLGYGQLLASWLDKPTLRANIFSWENANNQYYDDGYLIFSSDGGNNWEYNKLIEIETGIPENPTWYLKYAGNATNTGTLHEDGWSIAKTGKVEGNVIYTYAANQYMDYVAVIPPILNANDFQQFLHVWKVYYIISGIEAEEVSIAKDFKLLHNYPNPFNPVTNIQFSLQNDAKVKLSIFNTKGELVVDLKNEKLKKGSHSVSFDATKLNSGIYFYTLKVNDRSESKKMILVK